MSKCNWCGKETQDYYCSKKCEHEAVANGEKPSPQSQGGGCLLWIVIIAVGTILALFGAN